MSKVVLVTGGSRGIGANIVEALAKDGYNVILNYNNSENEARKIQENLLKQNINIDIYQADVSNHIEVTGLVNYCINKYHKIDVLINNAGISQIKLFTDISDIEWNNMIQTNLTSAFYTIKDTLPSMIHHKSGCASAYSRTCQLASCRYLRDHPSAARLRARLLRDHALGDDKIVPKANHQPITKKDN